MECLIIFLCFIHCVVSSRPEDYDYCSYNSDHILCLNKKDPKKLLTRCCGENQIKSEIKTLEEIAGITEFPELVRQRYQNLVLCPSSKQKLNMKYGFIAPNFPFQAGPGKSTVPKNQSLLETMAGLIARNCRKVNTNPHSLELRSGNQSAQGNMELNIPEILWKGIPLARNTA